MVRLIAMTSEARRQLRARCTVGSRTVHGEIRTIRHVAFVASLAVHLAGCKHGKAGAADGGTDHQKVCAETILELGSYRGKPLTYEDTVAEIGRLRLKANAGLIECRAAADTKGVAALEDIKRQLDRQEAAAKEENLATARALTKNKGNAPIDPGTCPKGKVMIDTTTGKTVRCTGAGTAGGGTDSDENDVQASCARVKEQWRITNALDPIIECGMADDTHRDVKVVVTSAGWDYLGEHGQRRAFAQSFVDSFRSHWKTIHGWNGADPAQRQVHVYRTNGADVALAALASAGGLYTE